MSTQASEWLRERDGKVNQRRIGEEGSGKREEGREGRGKEKREEREGEELKPDLLSILVQLSHRH